jgi:hypothetical protein
MKMGQSVPKASAYKIQMLGNYPEENIQHQLINAHEGITDIVHIVSHKTVCLQTVCGIYREIQM